MLSLVLLHPILLLVVVLLLPVPPLLALLGTATVARAVAGAEAGAGVLQINEFKVLCRLVVVSRLRLLLLVPLLALLLLRLPPELLLLPRPSLPLPLLLPQGL